MQYSNKTKMNRLKIVFAFCIIVMDTFYMRIWSESLDYPNKETHMNMQANSINIENIRKQFPVLFMHDIREASSFEDVVYNDGKRRGNLHEACPDSLMRSKVIVEFLNMLRPKNENNILYDYINNLIASEKDEKRLYRKLGRAFELINWFCTDDMRLYILAKESIENNASSTSAVPMIGSVLEFMGMCRVPEVTSYFATAVTEEYWKKLAKIDSEESNRNFTVHLNGIRHAVVFAITNLPADDALPILEQLWKKLIPSDYIYEVTWRALDEMWRRKKGDVPLFEYGTRYEYDDPEARPSAYPEWIYSVGGEKIEWPFGKPPAGYTPPRVHMDFF